MAASPRAATACPRGWFPPATFQLRLRSLRSILYIGEPFEKLDKREFKYTFSPLASPTPRNDQDSGYFYVTLHETVEGSAIWKSSSQRWTSEKETRLEWSDIDIDPATTNLGLRSIVVKVWFESCSRDSPPQTCLDATWGVYFSGLWCIGTHPPAHGRLPPNALIFQIHGNFFSSASHIQTILGGSKGNFIPRYLHLGTPEECQAVKSYDTKLIGRLHRTQRALKQQDLNNMRLIKDLRGKGIDRTLVSSEEVKLSSSNANGHEEDKALIVNPTALPSLRQTLFAKRFKQPQTRLAENSLQAQAELLRIRITLLKNEREKRRRCIESIRTAHQELMLQIEEKTSTQMHSYHNLSKEKAVFDAWQEQFRLDKVTNEFWSSVLRQERLFIINQLRQIFPIGDLGGKRPTLRWITLPPTNEIRESSKDDTQVSVAVGEAAHLTDIIARILDLPLRHIIRLMGSVSTIQDTNKLPHDYSEGKQKDSINVASFGDFPLHVKGSSSNEWSKFEYALYLLNKNVAQLRWQCGLITVDLRPTLHNLDEILGLGKDANRCHTDIGIPPIMTTTPPPSSFTAGVPLVVLKNGRLQSNSIPPRRGSSSNSDQTNASNNTDTDCDEKEQLPIPSNDEQILSSSSTSNDTSSSEVTNVAVAGDEKKEPMGDRMEELKMTTTEQKHFKKTEETEPSTSTIFWNDVQTRTKALETPSSFQRKRTNPY